MPRNSERFIDDAGRLPRKGRACRGNLQPRPGTTDTAQSSTSEVPEPAAITECLPTSRHAAIASAGSSGFGHTSRIPCLITGKPTARSTSCGDFAILPHHYANTPYEGCLPEAIATRKIVRLLAVPEGESATERKQKHYLDRIQDDSSARDFAAADFQNQRGTWKHVRSVGSRRMKRDMVPLISSFKTNGAFSRRPLLGAMMTSPRPASG